MGSPGSLNSIHSSNTSIILRYTQIYVDDGGYLDFHMNLRESMIFSHFEGSFRAL